MTPLKKGEKDFISSLEIQDILLLSSEHKVYAMFNSDRNIAIKFEKVGDINVILEKDLVIFETETSLELYDKNNKEKNNGLLLSSKAKFASIYSFNPEVLGKHIEDIEKFSIHFFQFSAVTHILAYAREYFYTILTKSGYPRVTLPLIKSLVDEDAEEAASSEIKKKFSSLQKKEKNNLKK